MNPTWERWHPCPRSSPHAERRRDASAPRLMGSLHDSKIAHRDHEPRSKPRRLDCGGTTPLWLHRGGAKPCSTFVAGSQSGDLSPQSKDWCSSNGSWEGTPPKIGRESRPWTCNRQERGQGCPRSVLRFPWLNYSSTVCRFPPRLHSGSIRRVQPSKQSRRRLHRVWPARSVLDCGSPLPLSLANGPEWRLGCARRSSSGHSQSARGQAQSKTWRQFVAALCLFIALLAQVSPLHAQPAANNQPRTTNHPPPASSTSTAPMPASCCRPGS